MRQTKGSKRKGIDYIGKYSMKLGKTKGSKVKIRCNETKKGPQKEGKNYRAMHNERHRK